MGSIWVWIANEMFGFIFGLLVGPIMRAIYPPAKIRNRIVVSLGGSMEVYLNSQAEKIGGAIIRVKNFLPFGFTIDAMNGEVQTAGKIYGIVNLVGSFPSVSRAGGETSFSLSEYQLSRIQAQELIDLCQKSGNCLAVKIDGNARIRVWFGSYSIPYSVGGNAFCHLRPHSPS